MDAWLESFLVFLAALLAWDVVKALAQGKALAKRNTLLLALVAAACLLAVWRW